MLYKVIAKALSFLKEGKTKLRTIYNYSRFWETPKVQQNLYRRENIEKRGGGGGGKE